MNRDDEALPVLRVAVLATPRSGNTWLRELLTPLLGLESLVAHTPADVPWQALPPRCVLQLHWPYGDIVERLQAASFRVVVLARHPLDVLVSILNFAQRAHETGSWLAGQGGDEESIRGASPLDPAFLTYATGPRAAALLSVTPSWWGRPETVCVRYEDLVASTGAELRRVAQELGGDPRQPVETVVGNSSLTALRDRHPTRRFHFWQASPGLWRSLLPVDVARPIVDENAAVFDVLGYQYDPDPQLTPHGAEVRWINLQVSGVTQELFETKAQLKAAETRLQDVSAKIAEQSQRFAEAHAAVVHEARGAERSAGDAHDRLSDLETRLYPLLGIARRLRHGLVQLDRRNPLSTREPRR